MPKPPAGTQNADGRDTVDTTLDATLSINGRPVGTVKEFERKVYEELASLSNRRDVTVIETGDRPICAIALTLLEAAIKKADKALQPLGAISQDVRDIEAGRGALKDLFFDADPETPGLRIPGHLLRALRVAVSLEYSITASVLEDQQDLQLEGDETATRLKQLERVLAQLDVAGMTGPTDQ